MNTGYRALAPKARIEPIIEVKKDDLYKAARDAASALSLRPSVRAILKELVGFFQHAVGGRAIVWPSNDVLVDRTGLSERAVRYAIRELITSRLVTSKDSANGKRFAVRSKSGQILDAFGFDLAPLIARWEDFKVVIDRRSSQKAADKRLREEVTITRRECLEALSELPCGSDRAELEERNHELTNSLPKRGQTMSQSLLMAWRELRERLLLLVYPAGSGGKECRHKETNNETPDQPCHKGHENGLGRFDLGALLQATPNALAFCNAPIRNESDLVRAAATMRGAIGASADAWREACATIGGGAASAALLIVIETYEQRVRAGEKLIDNPGGYFRSYVRHVRSGHIDLGEEIRRLRK